MKRHYKDRDLLIYDLIQHASDTVASDMPILISIDGLGGVGKSTLAHVIGSVSPARVLSVDDFLIPHKGTYLPHLRYAELEDALKAAEADNLRFIIVEGLCILAVLDQLGRRPEVSIYIRLVDEHGGWIDSFYYSEDNDLDEVLERLSGIDSCFPDKPGIGDEDRELVRYHVIGKPISRASSILDRVRQPPSTEYVSA